VFHGWAAIFGVYLYNSQKLKDTATAAAVTNNSTELENQVLLVARSASMKEKVSKNKIEIANLHQQQFFGVWNLNSISSSIVNLHKFTKFSWVVWVV